MISIELKCACGASVKVDDSQGTYLQRGGQPDEHGDTHIVQRIAREWRAEHQHHAAIAQVLR